MTADDLRALRKPHQGPASWPSGLTLGNDGKGHLDPYAASSPIDCRAPLQMFPLLRMPALPPPPYTGCETQACFSPSPASNDPKPDRQADLVLPGDRSLVKIGRMLEAVESGQIVIDPECRLLLGDNPGEPTMRAMCLLRVGIHRRHAIVIPVVLEVRGVAGQ